MTEPDQATHPDAPDVEAPDPGLPFTIETSPSAIEPGGEVVFTALISREYAETAFHAMAVFLLATGEEFGRSRLTDAPGGALRSEPVERIAPDAPGPHDIVVRLEGPDGTVLGEQATTVIVADHPIALTVWDIPPTIEIGADFTIMLGMKCPCGCDARGWSWQVSDQAGKVVAKGTTGPEPLPGTTGLFWSTVNLTAPRLTGAVDWTVTALVPEAEVPHAQRQLPLRLHVQPAPDYTLRVTAIDVATGKPVPHARVVAHPYRTVTNVDGVAELRMPSGIYTVFVSGSPYFAYKTVGELTANQNIIAEMHVDREYTDADAWA